MPHSKNKFITTITGTLLSAYISTKAVYAGCGPPIELSFWERHAELLMISGLLFVTTLVPVTIGTLIIHKRFGISKKQYFKIALTQGLLTLLTVALIIVYANTL